MSNRWKTKTLAELVGDRGITYGIVQPGSEFEGGVPLIRAGDISGGQVGVADLKRVDPKIEAKYRRSRLRGGEVLLTLVGNVGESVTVSPEMVGFNVARAVGVLPVKDDPGPKWVEYSLRSPDIQHLIATWCNTTVQHTLNLKEAAEIPIPIPPKAERDRVIEILSSLDDKIEANRAMNRTLEEMAQALYRQWFVDFGPFQDGAFVGSELGEIPKGWRIGAFKEVAVLKLGGTPSRKKPEYWGGEVNWINSGAVNQYRITQPAEMITELGLQKSAAKMLRPGSTVLAITGATLGQVSRVLIPTSANQSVIGLEAKEPATDDFVYHSLLHRLDDLLVHATGGAQQHVNKGNVSDLKMIIPSSEALSAFQKEVEPLHQLINVNVQEADDLAATHDYLLPKLLSGEILAIEQPSGAA